jgi:hypothetical protein
MLEIRGPMMVEGDFSHANIALEVFQKDIDLISDLARAARCPRSRRRHSFIWPRWRRAGSPRTPRASSRCWRK